MGNQPAKQAHAVGFRLPVPTVQGNNTEDGQDPLQGPIQPVFSPANVNSRHVEMRALHISRLAPGVLQWDSMRSIDISYNFIKTLPAEICLLPHLQKLNASHNRLVELPKDIGMLSSLTDLLVEANRLTSLPASLFEIKGLAKLNISYNQIARLDRRIGQLSAIVSLNVDGNPLSALPSEIGLLSLLRHLTSSNCKFLTEREARPDPLEKRIPSLFELAARTVVRHSLPFTTDLDIATVPGAPPPLPKAIAHYLSCVQTCSACKGPMFDTVLTRYRFVNRNLVSVPLEFSLCSAHWNSDADRIVFLFKTRPKTPAASSVGSTAPAGEIVDSQTTETPLTTSAAPPAPPAASSLSPSPSSASLPLQRRASNSSVTIGRSKRAVASMGGVMGKSPLSNEILQLSIAT